MVRQKNIGSLKQKLIDLKITNCAKDYFIEQLRNECESFALERKDYVEKLINSNRQIGKLETRLRQFGAPNREAPGDVASTYMAR